MNPSTLRTLWPSLAVAGLILVGYLAGNWLQPTTVGGMTPGWKPAADCDLGRESCAWVGPGGARVELSVSPEGLPLLKPLRFQIEVAGLSPTAMSMELQGINMRMPPNRVELAVAAGGQWIGTGVIPVCSQSRMQWRAWLSIATKAGMVALTVPFETQRGS